MKLNRRTFIRMATLGTVSVAVAACENTMRGVGNTLRGVGEDSKRNTKKITGAALQPEAGEVRRTLT